MLCRTRFPKAIISIGWTTHVDEVPLKTGYTRDMIDHMASLVKEYNLMQPVTFPVNATLLKYSVCELQRLLFQVFSSLKHKSNKLKYDFEIWFDYFFASNKQVPNSTLTIWAHPEEFDNNLSLHDLVLIRKAFSMSSVFYDMPPEILNQLRVEIYNN